MKYLVSLTRQLQASALCLGIAFLSTVSLGQQPSATTPPRFVVFDLGTLGGSFSLAYSVNNEGEVSGTSTLAGDAVQHSFLFKNGKMIDIGTLGGANSESFSNVNNRGQDSGTAENSMLDPLDENFCSFGDSPSLICLGFVWDHGVITALPTVGGNNAQAAAINDRGLVAGYAETSTADPECPAPQVLAYRPVIWQNAHPHTLPLYASDTEGAAFWINNEGDAVGASGICAAYDPRYALEIQPRHALLWHHGEAIDLGNLGGSMQNTALAISDRGQIVGASDIAGDKYQHAFLWQNGKMKDLGTLPGDVVSAAVAINNRGQVTGVSQDENGNIRGFLWQEGTMYDLNSLTAGNSALYLLHGFGINDAGVLVGLAFNTESNEVHGFLAVPVTASNDSEQPNTSSVARPLADSSREQIHRMVHKRYFGEQPPDPCKSGCK